MSLLIIAILIILSPVILIAGFISLVILLGITYLIISIPIEVAKKLKESKEKEWELIEY